MIICRFPTSEYGEIFLIHQNRKPFSMKKHPWLLWMVTFYFPAVKIRITPSINIADLPKEYTRYDAQNHSISFRVYKYDSNKNLAGIFFRQNDTIGGSVNVDTGSYYFNVDQTANLPTGYTSIHRNTSSTKAQVETHNLYFNNQKQVVKDSGTAVISGDNPNAPTKYFFYTDNTVARNSWIQSGSGWNMYLIDSLFTEGGNVKHYAQYANGGSGNTWTISDQYWVGVYSANKNPFYDRDFLTALVVIYCLKKSAIFFQRI